MLRALSIAATGGRALLQRIDVHAHNLAHADTVGFKRSRVRFAELVARTGPETPVGTGVRVLGTPALFEPGALQKTGRDLDLAIDGEGFFRIRGAGGEPAYTRAGRLHADASGFLVTDEGFALDPAIRVPRDAARLTIDQEGRVAAATAGGAGFLLGQLELVRFADPSALEPLGRNLFRAPAASGEPVSGFPGQSEEFGWLRQGYLESSNVDPVRELTDLVAAHRAFEINAKMIETADEVLQAVNRLGRRNS
jgi:flagellar basal-body rod protein FlgG